MIVFGFKTSEEKFSTYISAIIFSLVESHFVTFVYQPLSNSKLCIPHNKENINRIRIILH